eukprot:771809-Pelagomonas_calceolata.AAC.1
MQSVLSEDHAAMPKSAIANDSAADGVAGRHTPSASDGGGGPGGSSRPRHGHGQSMGFGSFDMGNADFTSACGH